MLVASGFVEFVELIESVENAENVENDDDDDDDDDGGKSMPVNVDRPNTNTGTPRAAGTVKLNAGAVGGVKTNAELGRTPDRASWSRSLIPVSFAVGSCLA